MSGVQSYSSWTISLAELILRVLQMHQPEILLPGTDVIGSSEPWRDDVPAPRCQCRNTALRAGTYSRNIEYIKVFHIEMVVWW